jgi:hypothetical protein
MVCLNVDPGKGSSLRVQPDLGRYFGIVELISHSMLEYGPQQRLASTDTGPPAPGLILALVSLLSMVCLNMDPGHGSSGRIDQFGEALVPGQGSGCRTGHRLVLNEEHTCKNKARKHVPKVLVQVQSTVGYLPFSTESTNACLYKLSTGIKIELN